MGVIHNIGDFINIFRFKTSPLTVAVAMELIVQSRV